MKLSKEQIDAVLSLPAPQRYEHFVKQVADQELVWGLFDDGWAISSDGSNEAIPIWCASEYSDLSQNGDWQNYSSTTIDLDTFLNDMLPKMKENNISAAVMLLPEGDGIIVSSDQLIHDINEELGKY